MVRINIYNLSFISVKKKESKKKCLTLIMTDNTGCQKSPLHQINVYESSCPLGDCITNANNHEILINKSHKAAIGLLILDN